MPYAHILVPVDDSSISYAAATHALSLAKTFGSRVTLLSVVKNDPFIGVDFYQVAPSVTEHFLQAEQQAQSRLEEMRQPFIAENVPVELIIEHGNATEGILTTANTINADLIVMGSHGRTGFKRLVLGSVAQTVLEQAAIPVFIVRQ